MESILEELYSYFQPMGSPRDPEWESKHREYSAMCDRIVRQYGLDFMDRFLQLKSDLDGDRELRCFQKGLRLGARLILELTSATP